MSLKKLQALNVFFYIVMVIVNFLAVRLPFFGRRPGDVSDLYPNLFTPPNFSFKIWIVLYTLLGVFVFHQAKGFFQKEKPVPKEVGQIGFLFILSCFFNMGWLVTWQSLHFWPSFAMLFFLWATLILIYYRLAPFNSSNWLFALPISAYLAWVAVAGLANLYVTLMASGFSFGGLSQESIGIIGVSIGVFGGLLVLVLNKDWWFIMVLIWAILGIFIKNVDNAVGTTALIGMLILFFSSLFSIWWNYKKHGLVSGG